MNVMLVAMFAAVGVGLFATKFGRRDTILCVVIAVALTLVYFFRPATMT